MTNFTVSMASFEDTHPFAFFMLDKIPDEESKIKPIFLKQFPNSNINSNLVEEPAYTSLSELSQRVKEWDARVLNTLQTKSNQRIIRVLSHPLFRYVLPIVSTIAAVSVLLNFTSVAVAGGIGLGLYAGLGSLGWVAKDEFINDILQKALESYSKEPGQMNKPNLIGQIKVLQSWKKEFGELFYLLLNIESLEHFCSGKVSLENFNVTSQPSENTFSRGRVNHMNWQASEFDKVENNPDIQRLFTL